MNLLAKPRIDKMQPRAMQQVTGQFQIFALVRQLLDDGRIGRTRQSPCHAHPKREEQQQPQSSGNECRLRRFHHPGTVPQAFGLL
jgi:hypothetical protein